MPDRAILAFAESLGTRRTCLALSIASSFLRAHGNDFMPGVGTL